MGSVTINQKKMANHKKYWKSTAELDSINTFVKDLKEREFVEKLPNDAFLGNEEAMNNSKTNRRDFLKYVGFRNFGIC